MAKTVLITGASCGIGYTTAELLTKNGYKVYTSQESAKAAVDMIISTEGRIDVLFNNARYGSYGPIETVSLQEAQIQMESMSWVLPE